MRWIVDSSPETWRSSYTWTTHFSYFTVLLWKVIIAGSWIPQFVSLATDCKILLKIKQSIRV